MPLASGAARSPAPAGGRWRPVYLGGGCAALQSGFLWLCVAAAAHYTEFSTVAAMAHPRPPAQLAAAEQRLAVRAGRFYYRGVPTFLSGANQPWLHYGADFGNHRPTESDYCTLKNEYLLPVQRAGGHHIR
eukprot:SAG31_NODE_20035_length_585_cov_1.150206_1_plen_130_part_01